jgi:hypothetical protein
MLCFFMESFLHPDKVSERPKIKEHSDSFRIRKFTPLIMSITYSIPAEESYPGAHTTIFRFASATPINFLANASGGSTIVTSDEFSKYSNIFSDSNISSSKVSNETNGSLQLSNRLSRLRWVKCYYISYLVNNESRKCLRCSSSELRDFPGTNTHHKVPCRIKK